MNATIYDVAETAGVSISTVSRVINNAQVVSPATRQRVELAMQTLSFVPNSMARSLMIKSTRSLGAIVADITNPYYAELLRAIQDAADEMGYSVISCNSDENMDKECRMMNTLLEKQVDVIILVGGRGSGKEFSNHVYELTKKTQVILCNEYLRHENLHCVVCDKRTGAYLATQYLQSLGHERIAFINGGAVYKPSVEKMKGYRQAMEERGLATPEEYTQYGDYHIDSGAACVQKLLSLASPPTAIITSNDLMAMGAIKALSRAGLKVPRDMSVMGFDDISLNHYSTPELTSVSQKLSTLGRLAVELVPKVLEGTAPHKTVVQPELVIRETCCPPQKG